MLGTTAYTVSKLKRKYGCSGTDDYSIWIRKKQNYESLASALLMKQLLAADINLLLFFFFSDLAANHSNICKHHI